MLQITHLGSLPASTQPLIPAEPSIKPMPHSSTLRVAAGGGFKCGGPHAYRSSFQTSRAKTHPQFPLRPAKQPSSIPSPPPPTYNATIIVEAAAAKKMTPLSLFLLSLFLLSTTTTVRCAGFNCSSTTTCQSLIGYVPVNKTTIAEIQSLFTVDSLASLLGANNLPLYTPATHAVRNGSIFRVPIPCSCSGGKGISNGKPIYIVKTGDFLYFIATFVFSQLVTYPDIAAANNISDPSLILVGQELRIPLPCSCDDVDIGNGDGRVVHYAHVAATGSTVKEIAAEFGSNEQTLLRLNNMTNSGELKAGQVLDVPLRACSSSISSTSTDSSLLVPNKSYALTAHNCVQCSCDSSDWQLKCKPSQGANITNWPSCPLMKCEGDTSIGITTSTSCGLATCTYKGYNAQRILAENLCPNNGTSGSQPAGNSAAGRSGLQNSKWIWIFISANLGLFSLGLFW